MNSKDPKDKYLEEYNAFKEKFDELNKKEKKLLEEFKQLNNDKKIQELIAMQKEYENKRNQLIKGEN